MIPNVLGCPVPALWGAARSGCRSLPGHLSDSHHIPHTKSIQQTVRSVCCDWGQWGMHQICTDWLYEPTWATGFQFMFEFQQPDAEGATASDSKDTWRRTTEVTTWSIYTRPAPTLPRPACTGLALRWGASIMICEAGYLASYQVCSRHSGTSCTGMTSSDCCDCLCLSGEDAVESCSGACASSLWM